MNVAVNLHRHNRQIVFAINSNHHIPSQKGINGINLVKMRLRHDKFPKSPVPKIDVLGLINVAIVYYRHNHQNMFPIKSNHH